MNKRKSILLRILLIIGFLIFFYPNISDYISNINGSKVIVNYNRSISGFKNIEKQKIKKEAEDYNRKIFLEKNSIYYPKLIKGYEENLNPFKDGMMGSLVIDKIGVNLPIYHGVNEGVIQKGIGHLQGTSLPIGGKSTHSVLSTHSGLPSARLFTDLHKLKKGDEFEVSVLGENMYYKVDQIKTVLPKEVGDLKVEKDRDYVTLLTCTPYGINTHRLLVRGERINRTKKSGKNNVEKKAEKGAFIRAVKLILILGIILTVAATIIRDVIALKKERNQEKNRKNI